jgi:hypothetical protein
MNLKTNEYSIEPGQPWKVDLFRPEDAEGVARLFLSVYGEGYPIRTYLDPERLIQENAAGRIISSVARTPKGDVVGHNALFNSAPFQGIYECGAGVVHAVYRGGAGVFTRLVAHGQDVGAREFGVRAIFGESVCNHVFSQKMCHNLGWTSHALEVDLMPAAAYVKERSAPGRVASLVDYVTISPGPHKVFLPGAYEASLRFLYSGLDDQREFLTSDASFPIGSKTTIRTQSFAFARVARCAVPESGVDFAGIIEKEERDVLAQRPVVIQVWLNLAEPWVSAAVEILRAMGFFFGGLLPRWFDTDGLLMQKIIGEPCWEGMQIYFDRAKSLVDMVRADWKETAGK